MTFRLGTTPALAPELAGRLARDGDERILRERTSAAELFAALGSGDMDGIALPARALWDRGAEELEIAAVLPRSEPRDVLVPAGGAPLTLDTLPSGGRVALRGARRLALLAVHRPDVRALPLVNGHLPRDVLASGGVDALILGSAEARRVGLADAATEVIPAKSWLPAPGQGAVAVLVAHGNAAAAVRLSGLDHAPSRAALRAERALAVELAVDHDGPLSALALPYGRWLRLWAMVVSGAGRRVVRAEVSGADDRPEALAGLVAELLRARGAGVLLA